MHSAAEDDAVVWLAVSMRRTMKMAMAMAINVDHDGETAVVGRIADVLRDDELPNATTVRAETAS
jgi:hypothetical protein